MTHIGVVVAAETAAHANFMLGDCSESLGVKAA